MERLTYWNEEYGCYSYHCASGDAAKKLAAYEDAEEQGRLVVLPCRLGDIVYCIYPYGMTEFYQSNRDEFEKIYGKDYYKKIEWVIGERVFQIGDFDFLSNKIKSELYITREEAETALSRSAKPEQHSEKRD